MKYEMSKHKALLAGLGGCAKRKQFLRLGSPRIFDEKKKFYTIDYFLPPRWGLNPNFDTDFDRSI